MQDLGRLELRRVDDLVQKEEKRNDALKSASQYFKAAIEAAPARAFPWSLEVYTRLRSKASSAELNELLRMSYFLGPDEASSILLRVRVGCEIWSYLEADVRRFVGTDLERIWRNGALRSALVPIYLSTPMATRADIRRTILLDERSERLFDQMLQKTIVAPKRS